MLGRDVERREVVEILLDMRPLRHGESISPKIATISSIVWLMGWICPAPGRGTEE
jgi:hypothetical protein